MEPSTPLKDAPRAPVATVQVNGTEVTLLGTAHVSQQSVADVQRLLAEGDYDAVAVELCEPRYTRLTGVDDWGEVDLLQILKSGRGGLFAAQLALSAYQARLGEQLDVEPGAEMRAAVEAARASETPLWLIDRNIGITLKRLVRKVPWYERWPLMLGVLGTFLSRKPIDESEIESLKEGDLLESTFSEFAEQSPQLSETLIHERDLYMAARLQEEIRRQQPRRVLAVIGAGHLAGTRRELEKQGEPTTVRTALDTLPKPGIVSRVFPWLIIALVLVAFGIGFSRSTEMGLQLITQWVLINGTLTALGALLARGHPWTVLTAFVAAPFTSLVPVIGAGMVTGAVQVLARPPAVHDFEAMREDITQLRTWWQNKVIRVMLVFVLCTIGSASATYIAGFRIYGQLFGG